MSSRYSSFTNSGSSDLSSSRVLAKTKNEQSLSAMMKKLMAKKPKGSADPGALADDLKKHVKKGSNFSGLHKKLFSTSASGNRERQNDVKALTQLNSNTRSLGMVLRSERELLTLNKDLELEITDLNLTIQDRNREVEKLKDLCLKQREEIKALKTAILFPDVMSSQLQELLAKQGSELKQAKQLIPSLQRQVTSLTGQLQFLAEDLEEVKADKYSVRGCYDNVSSPRTPIKYQEEAANSLEFSSPGEPSPDVMLLKDFNPCLTPYYATKSKGYNSLHDDRLCEISKQTSDDLELHDHSRKMSKSSDYRNSRNTSFQGTRRSDESKFKYGKQQMQHKLF